MPLPLSLFYAKIKNKFKQILEGSGKMDEKQYRENQTGYDKDTFGEVNSGRYTSGQSGAQGTYSQSAYEQNAQQTPPPDGGSFYHSSSQPGGNGFGIASMVLGILAIVFFCGCLNIPLAIISIIFAIIHINRKTGSIGFAIAGIVTSVISVILTVIMIVVFCVAGVGTTSLMYSETLPFEYFMDGDDYFEFDGDEQEGGDDLPFGGHHHGQDL